MSQQTPGTLLHIELARGLAALMILVFHLIVLGQARYQAFPFDVTPLIPFLSGSIDLFFMISGFLMLHTTQAPHNRRAVPFMLKRLIRIFPSYWLVLGGQIIVLLLKPDWFHRLSAAQPAIWHSVLLLPHQAPPILMVAWTLVFEMYFYWLFAATLFLPRAYSVYGAGAVFRSLRQHRIFLSQRQCLAKSNDIIAPAGIHRRHGFGDVVASHTTLALVAGGVFADRGGLVVERFLPASKPPAQFRRAVPVYFTGFLKPRKTRSISARQTRIISRRHFLFFISGTRAHYFSCTGPD